MAATFGYGKKTFIQGLARLSCRMAKYIVKYNAKLKKYLGESSAAYTCVTGMADCLNKLCALLNTSEK